MTPAQKKGLARLVAASKNVQPHQRTLYYHGPRGLGYAAWHRMMQKLCTLGFATPYVHNNEYEVTEAGKAQLQRLIAEAESEASRALGNSNEAREAGDIAKADRILERSQHWLDEANDLRGWGGP
jgi:hypothetical protein